MCHAIVTSLPPSHPALPSSSGLPNRAYCIASSVTTHTRTPRSPFSTQVGRVIIQAWWIPAVFCLSRAQFVSEYDSHFYAGNGGRRDLRRRASLDDLSMRCLHATALPLCGHSLAMSYNSINGQYRDCGAPGFRRTRRNCRIACVELPVPRMRRTILVLPPFPGEMSDEMFGCFIGHVVLLGAS
ncbi:hypothetical protein C8R44DRAFT_874318 [Mycena epipterygia]|nr:hypothetical protein C8R44DRAFT_874318 [Mycena epipterygia]